MSPQPANEGRCINPEFYTILAALAIEVVIVAIVLLVCAL